VTRRRVLSITIAVGWLALVIVLVVGGLGAVAVANHGGVWLLIVGLLLCAVAAILWWPDRR
jgi:uncharacterized sodium:solute symporter family permease YidK